MKPILMDSVSYKDHSLKLFRLSKTDFEIRLDQQLMAFLSVPESALGNLFWGFAHPARLLFESHARRWVDPIVNLVINYGVDLDSWHSYIADFESPDNLQSMLDTPVLDEVSEPVPGWMTANALGTMLSRYRTTIHNLHDHQRVCVRWLGTRKLFSVASVLFIANLRSLLGGRLHKRPVGVALGPPLDLSVLVRRVSQMGLLREGVSPDLAERILRARLAYLHSLVESEVWTAGELSPSEVLGVSSRLASPET